MEPRFGRDFQHVRIHTDSKASKSAKASAPGENRTGMPDPLKAGLEQLSGLDMSDTRVHFNSAKPAQLNALAYTQGKDIEVGPGQERHLPHEGWHVVQQMKGQVKPTLQAKGVSINDDAALEREADVMGAKALQMTSRDQVTLGSTLLQRREEAVSSFRVQVAGLTTSPPQSAIPAIQRRVKPDRAIDPEGLNVVGEFHSESEARSKAPIGETPEEKDKVWYTPDEKLPKKDESDRLGGEYGDPPHLRLMFILENLQGVCWSMRRAREEHNYPGMQTSIEDLRLYLDRQAKLFDPSVAEGRDVLSKTGVRHDWITALKRRLDSQLVSLDYLSAGGPNYLPAWDVKIKSMQDTIRKSSNTIRQGDAPGEMPMVAARSWAMHRAACKYASIKAVWKIGDSHVDDICNFDLEDVPYTLITRAQFNELLIKTQSAELKRNNQEKTEGQIRKEWIIKKYLIP